MYRRPGVGADELAAGVAGPGEREERGATMTNASYERRASATGRRVHWARPGDRYALCGSVVVDADVVADDRPVVALLTSCIACERKRPRVGIEG